MEVARLVGRYRLLWVSLVLTAVIYSSLVLLLTAAANEKFAERASAVAETPRIESPVSDTPGRPVLAPF